MINFYEKVFKIMFQEKVLKVIDDIVKKEIEENVDIKQFYSCEDILNILDKIQDQIMLSLFSTNSVPAEESTDVDDSSDSINSNQNQSKTWLVA